MRGVVVGLILNGFCLVAGLAGASAQPLDQPAADARPIPIADYPEPRGEYAPPPDGRYGRPRDDDEGEVPRFDERPRTGRYVDEERREERYGRPPRGDDFEPRSRHPRCWVRPGYDGPERVCRW